MIPIFFYLDKKTPLTLEMVQKYIEVFQSQNLPRLEKLKKYYDNKNTAINMRTFTNKDVPNNKIATPYASYITDVIASYFMGKNPTYNSQDNSLLSEINAIFNFNDEHNHNSILATQQSIYGYAIELMYLDDKSNIRFTALDPRQTILIYENTLEQKLLYTIRFYNITDILTGNKTLNVEIYTKNDIMYYKQVDSNLILMDSAEHYFNDIPVNVYKNNDDCTGDFEKIIKLIDAFDFAMSDSQNERDNFNDSYMTFINTGLKSDSEDDMKILQSMKDSRNIVLDNDLEGKPPTVDFLIKKGNVSETEANKDRIEKLIHKLSFIGDLSADSIKSHTSATQSKLSTLGLEQSTSKKESFFRFGLQRRIEIITNILNLKGSNYDYRRVNITFTRNLPTDEVIIADMISKLTGIVSNETLLEQIPFVTDIEQEKERLKAQLSNNNANNENITANLNDN